MLAFVHHVEGGYVNDPDDPGGATNYGITQRAYDAWRVRRKLASNHVGNITDGEVTAIYLEAYWVPGRCDELVAPWDLLHFDACVNLGKPEDGFRRSWKVLQRAVGVDDDGIPGPVTLGRVNGLTLDHIVDPENFWWSYVWERLLYYRRAVKYNPRLLKFLSTWIWRLDELRTEINL